MNEAINAKLELLEIELETVRLFARRSPHGSVHEAAARERESELLGEIRKTAPLPEVGHETLSPEILIKQK